MTCFPKDISTCRRRSLTSTKGTCVASVNGAPGIGSHPHTSSLPIIDSVRAIWAAMLSFWTHLTTKVSRLNDFAYKYRLCPGPLCLVLSPLLPQRGTIGVPSAGALG